MSDAKQPTVAELVLGEVKRHILAYAREHNEPPRWADELVRYITRERFDVFDAWVYKDGGGDDGPFEDLAYAVFGPDFVTQLNEAYKVACAEGVGGK